MANQRSPSAPLVKRHQSNEIAYPLVHLETSLSNDQTTTTSHAIYPNSWLSQHNDRGALPSGPQEQIEMASSQVELSISCYDLPNADIVTKSDPQVILYAIDLSGKTKLYEIGRTEMIADDLNPKFAKKILMQYHFEQIQKLRFEVIDIDPVGGNDFLGYLETTLADIVTSRSSQFKQPLVGGPRKRPGYLIVDIEELTTCKQVITFNLMACNLPASLCGLLSPSTRVHIYRSNEKGTLTIVNRTPCIRRGSSPRFKPFHLKLVTLCNGDLDRTIRFEFIDERFNLQRHLGYFETTTSLLCKSFKESGNKQNVSYNLLRQKKAGTRRTTTATTSTALITDFRLLTQATFLDYIRAGAQIHFVVAIDFTASNGDPALSSSLHYLDPFKRRLNPYEDCLLAVGNILKPYDTLGLFAGFGFGAKLNGSNRPPSHLFPLNGNDQHPYVSSVEELHQVYRRKLADVILSGPTNFASCIQHCDNIAGQFEDGNHYFVLLIITDGIISDMTQTKHAIVAASKKPLSIIICGVGDADFEAMDELDSDDSLLCVDGKRAERDIVQFVPMNRFKPSGYLATDSTTNCVSASGQQRAQQLLAEEVLREIPDQLTGYMVSRGFHPDLTYAS